MELKKILQNRNNRIMLVILIIGVVIIMFSGMRKGAESESFVSNDFSGGEERLSEILSQIDGVGEVSVMISYASTPEKDIAYDSDNTRAVTAGGEVMVKRELYPEVEGVIVTADGAGDAAVKNRIKEAVIAITGASAHRVCVYERSGSARKNAD